jgi:hypothetical protein
MRRNRPEDACLIKRQSDTNRALKIQGRGWCCETIYCVVFAVGAAGVS